MASDTKTALELWERSVEQVKLATGALQAALKLMEAATTKVVHDAWDTVCSARAALRSAVAEEADRFTTIEDQRRQTEMDLEGKTREGSPGTKVEGSGVILEQGGLKLLPPGAPPTAEEAAVEDPDAVVDDDEDEDAEDGEDAAEDHPGNLTDRPGE